MFITVIGQCIGYTHALQEYVIEHVNESEIAKEQISKPEINVFTGMEFDGAESVTELSKGKCKPPNRADFHK